MLKKLLPAILLLGSTSAFAQIPSLTGATADPVVRDTFISIACDTTGILPGTGGASITWTFSSLVHSPVISPYYDTVGVAYFGPTDPGYSSLSTMASILTPVGTPAFQSSNYAAVTPSGMGTTYNQSSALKISQTGVYINSGDFAVYSDPLDALRFPFSYDSTFTDTYAGGIVYTPSGAPTPVTATENGSVTVTCDGYGKLILPGTPTVTYNNVLRVHSSQSFRDSANLFGTPVTGTYDLETYTWYMPGYHSPLLTIATTTGLGVNTKTVSYAYKQVADHEAVPTVHGISNSLSIYPNPATNYIYISYDNATNERVRISLTDMLGREVSIISDQTSQGNTYTTCSTAGLSKGLYLVKLQSGTETVTRKIEIQ